MSRTLVIQSGEVYIATAIEPLQNFQSNLFCTAIRLSLFFFCLPLPRGKPEAWFFWSGARKHIVRPRWKSTRGFSSISSSQSTRRVVDSAVPAISLSRIVFPSVAWKSHQRHTIVKPSPSFARSFLLWSRAQLPMHVGQPTYRTHHVHALSSCDVETG